MNHTYSNIDTLLSALPAEGDSPILPHIAALLKERPRKVVVLDDDPTGTQTVHGIPVLTHWSVEALTEALTAEGPAFYILTNSRSLTGPNATELNLEIGRNLMAARDRAKIDFVLVSRSDSTLRGHFPAEMRALMSIFPKDEAPHAWLIIPFFLEGGRYTVENVHYVAEGDRLIPAAETPFAKDKAFGYTHSDLKRWVEEKSEGEIAAEDVVTISIAELRQNGPDHVAQRLLELKDGAVCIVNSASYRDQELFVLALLKAEQAGKRFLYRTAASFVRPRVGLDERPLLTRAELHAGSQHSDQGGLIIVGSYVPKTTAQLKVLFADAQIEEIEVRVDRLLEAHQRLDEIDRVVDALNRAISSGLDCAVFTSRGLVSGSSAAKSLAIGQIISESLVQIVQQLEARPRYLIAKGGITSSDVATKGLGIRKGWVMGQILPGIPVWRTGPECRFPDMSYVIFPGNVGSDRALLDAVNKLS